LLLWKGKKIQLDVARIFQSCMLRHFGFSRREHSEGLDGNISPRNLVVIRQCRCLNRRYWPTIQSYNKI